MKALFLLLVLGLFAGCSRVELPALASPSGTYFARAEISGDEAGTVKRLCVRLRVLDQASKKEAIFQTDASDRMKWAIAWAAEKTLVLYSSDVGMHAYDIREGSITERPPTESEKDVARIAYEKRYGQKPRA